MQHGPSGEVLNVGRRRRTISPALRRALAARDGHCRFPGCAATRCDAHHVEHWAHGGATALDNLVLLCRRHHRAVHEEGFRVVLGRAGVAQFVRPDGRPLPEAPTLPAVTDAPLAPVTARLVRAGIRVGPHTATPAWRGERLDVDWAVNACGAGGRGNANHARCVLLARVRGRRLFLTCCLGVPLLLPGDPVHPDQVPRMHDRLADSGRRPLYERVARGSRAD